jgi:DNA-binding transcriptional regulator GbsR (MarR family)
MPINVNEYEAHGEDRLPLTPGTNAATIMQFLSQHPEQGFTPKEIHEATGVKRGSVGVVLHRLEKRDLVRHVDHYWTLGDDQHLATYAAMYHSMEALNDRFGEEDIDEWIEHAADESEF